MRSRTLTETLLAEEETGEYKTYRYDKTATAYMFGYANCPSGFGGSGFGRAGNFGIGGGGIARHLPDLPLTERYRWDTSHSEPHLNFEIAIDTPGKRRPLLQKHTKIKW